MFHDKVPWVPIAHGATREEVSGLVINLFGRDIFATVEVPDP